MQVYCVMYDDRQVTLVEHNYPNRTWVKDAEAPGSYMAHFKYSKLHVYTSTLQAPIGKYLLWIYIASLGSRPSTS